jgi:predicted aminopeptidase
MNPLRKLKRRGLGIGILFLIVLSGCSTAAYVTRMGFGQAKVLLFSRSNEKVLRDPSINQETKDRIQFVLEVKDYAEGRIGLKKTENYSSYFEVDGQGLLYVISACPKDSLDPYQWTFPIVGRMSYKGFFRLKGAQKEREQLERAGFDTCLRRALAYSTLGWFKDPIFSPMLDQRRAVIAQIVIHELTHTTLFIEDHLDFNEQMATFIGNQLTSSPNGMEKIPRTIGMPEMYCTTILSLESSSGAFALIYVSCIQGICRGEKSSN